MSRSAKRARLSGPSAEDSSTTAQDDIHTSFTSWARQRGVEIQSVAPQQLPGRGLGLMTTAPVKAGERFLFVPEKAMFKPDAVTIKRGGLERASPQAKLAVSALAKFSSPSSPLHEWQATWPTKNDFSASMPMCWPANLVEHLPPAVMSPLERQKADYARDWEAAQALCGERGWDEETFRYYWCIVNSRSFHWKPSAARAGSMVLCPFVDYMNHGPTGSGCSVTQSARGYEVVAERNYEAGEEVLATYGAHSNDKLLVHYGFICASPLQHASADDEIRLDQVILPDLSEATKSQLQDVGFLGAYALLPSSYPCEHLDDAEEGADECAENCRQPWEICFKTQVAVRAVLLTANEWEYFVTNGEDLSGDESDAVNQWLKPRLEALRSLAKSKEEILEKLDETVDEENQTAVSMLRGRWNQIAVHVAHHLHTITS